MGSPTPRSAPGTPGFSSGMLKFDFSVEGFAKETLGRSVIIAPDIPFSSLHNLTHGGPSGSGRGSGGVSRLSISHFLQTPAPIDTFDLKAQLEQLKDSVALCVRSVAEDIGSNIGTNRLESEELRPFLTQISRISELIATLKEDLSQARS